MSVPGSSDPILNVLISQEILMMYIYSECPREFRSDFKCAYFSGTMNDIYTGVVPESSDPILNVLISQEL